MKKIFLLVLATAAVLTVGAQPGTGSIINKGDAVPDFQIQMTDGANLNMSDLKGKVVMLNFWATWCPPCRAKLAVVQEGLIDKIDSDDFVFLAVSRGEELDKVLKFREQNGYTFPMAADPDTLIFPLFASSGIPRHYLIDREGVVVETGIGFNSAEEDPFRHTIKTIERILNNK